MSVQRIHVIDSHTGGEPTRVVIAGGPDLGAGTLADRLARFQREHDSFRSAVVTEPRGSEVLVGGLLVEPSDPSCAVGVVFFNNVGYLGMCGHGMIGLVETLAYLGRIAEGDHRIDTPAGVVTTTLRADGRISVRNVPSYRFAKDVPVAVVGHGSVSGDIAYGGNWFFLTGDWQIPLLRENVDALTGYAWAIREALARSGIAGPDGEEIDHIELFAPSPTSGVGCRNFVLCPGKAYDRSPCGTGTSAKLACLYADGNLAVGETWRQESIIGSVFEGSVERSGDVVIPTITGRAYITAETTLIIDPADPFGHGIR